jgi:hypothetical protein
MYKVVRTLEKIMSISTSRFILLQTQFRESSKLVGRRGIRNDTAFRRKVLASLNSIPRRPIGVWSGWETRLGRFIKFTIGKVLNVLQVYVAGRDVRYLAAGEIGYAC